MTYRHVSTLLGTYVLADRTDLQRMEVGGIYKNALQVDNITLGLRVVEGADLPPQEYQIIDVLDTPTMVQHTLRLAIEAVAKG
jgi:hypothetical protein